MFRKIQNFIAFSILLLFSVALLQLSVFAQSRSERREARIEESAKFKSVAGGEQFQINVPYDKAYDGVLNFLKKQDYDIESASRETGQIVTAITVKGGWRQTGTRVQMSFITDSASATTVKVAVTEQKRYKLLQTEPWGDGKVNSKKSLELASRIKSALD